MPDLWTAEDVERAAIALFICDWPEETAWSWRNQLTEAAKAEYSEKAATVLAALAEAGRLQTGDAVEEWGVRWHGKDVETKRYFHDGSRRPPETHDRASAQRVGEEFSNAQAVRRWVGPWLPVQPEPEPQP